LQRELRDISKKRAESAKKSKERKAAGFLNSPNSPDKGLINLQITAAENVKDSSFLD